MLPLIRSFLLLVVVAASSWAQDSIQPTERLQALRVVDGDAVSGSVQVYNESLEWTYVCDDGFGFAEADAVCRQMGLAGAERYTRNDHFGSITPAMRKSSPNFYSNRLNCSEENGKYSECPSADTALHDCATTEVAGVVCLAPDITSPVDEFRCEEGLPDRIPRDQVCDGEAQCSDNSDEAANFCTDMAVVRLQSTAQVNIPGAVLGSVQVKHNEMWGVMCDDRASEKEAKVVCRALGYPNGWAVGFSGSYLGEASGPMIVDTPGCTGDEQTLRQCPGIELGVSDCPESNEDFGVFCYDEGIEVRLAGSESPDSGQVEMKMSGQWGTVCDHGFDVFDAQVVCRMLGYDGDAVARRGSGSSHTGLIWGIRLDCLGKEQDVEACRIRIMENSCPLSQTASVTCSRRRGTVDAALKTALGNPDCGIPEDASNQFITKLGKVLGGSVRSRFDTPWLVSLRRTAENGGRIYCGGSIISEDFIVTAAHCLRVVGKLTAIIRVGDYNANIKEDSEEEFTIDKAWAHEYSDEHAFNDNDVALIKIQRKNGRGMRFGARVKPICLPSVYDDYDKIDSCTVAGWGPTFFLNDPEPRPREGQTNIISDYTCEGSLGGPSNYTSSIVCVGQFFPRVNACKGDSGGPLACPVDGRQTLYGLVSSGRACTFTTSADMYTRVSKFVDWIFDKVQLSQR